MCVCCGQRGLTQTPLAVTCWWCPRACWPGQVPAGVTVLPGGGVPGKLGAKHPPGNWPISRPPSPPPALLGGKFYDPELSHPRGSGRTLGGALCSWAEGWGGEAARTGLGLQPCSAWTRGALRGACALRGSSQAPHTRAGRVDSLACLEKEHTGLVSLCPERVQQRQVTNTATGENCPQRWTRPRASESPPDTSEGQALRVTSGRSPLSRVTRPRKEALCPPQDIGALASREMRVWGCRRPTPTLAPLAWPLSSGVCFSFPARRFEEEDRVPHRQRLHGAGQGQSEPVPLRGLRPGGAAVRRENVSSGQRHSVLLPGLSGPGQHGCFGTGRRGDSGTALRRLKGLHRARASCLQFFLLLF